MPGRYKLGRAPKDEEGFTVVGFGDAGMSRDHFALEVGVAAVILRDLGSTNGSFVEGRRVERSATLENGQILQVGRHVIKLGLILNIF